MPYDVAINSFYKQGEFLSLFSVIVSNYYYTYETNNNNDDVLFLYLNL